MYREVTMNEIKEVLRLWLGGMPKKRIAAQVSLDPKTVRRYVAVAETSGLAVAQGPSALTDEVLTQVLVALHPTRGRAHGASWAICAAQHATVAKYLAQGVRLTKIRRLLQRQGVHVPYPTLHRYAVEHLQFGRTAPTVLVADGEPGYEVQLDTGWVGWLQLLTGNRRRFKAWIFTAVVSRHRFVYPITRETTVEAIAACEAAWAFFGGIFRVLIPDNTKAIVHTADPLAPRIVDAFLEYAQARGFHLDPTRVRHPKDKGRVERAVQPVRDDCYAGEVLTDLTAARTRGEHWCRAEYGLRRHRRTQRLPVEHFAEEAPHLLPVPTTPYDPPQWSAPVVGRDQHAEVDYALYSLPAPFRRRTLRARADTHLVRFYDGPRLVRTHPRQPRGGRVTAKEDLPPERAIYAMRDTPALLAQAQAEGPAIGAFAAALLDDPRPWARMRHVYALLGLVRRLGAARVEAACAQANAVDLRDVTRLRRMLEHPTRPLAPPETRALPRPRFLRPSATPGGTR
jgi:transposase